MITGTVGVAFLTASDAGVLVSLDRPRVDLARGLVAEHRACRLLADDAVDDEAVRLLKRPDLLLGLRAEPAVRGRADALLNRPDVTAGRALADELADHVHPAALPASEVRPHPAG